MLRVCVWCYVVLMWNFCFSFCFFVWLRWDLPTSYQNYRDFSFSFSSDVHYLLINPLLLSVSFLLYTSRFLVLYISKYKKSNLSSLIYLIQKLSFFVHFPVSVVSILFNLLCKIVVDYLIYYYFYFWYLGSLDSQPRNFSDINPIIIVVNNP